MPLSNKVADWPEGLFFSKSYGYDHFIIKTPNGWIFASDKPEDWWIPSQLTAIVAGAQWNQIAQL